MILVLLGTNPYDFSRLARAADDYARQTGEQMFMQLGYTSYRPHTAQAADFLEKKELLAKIAAADLVITQGGAGSISDCLKAGKKVVAVPRRLEMQEAPDRQEELVLELERVGRLVGVYDIGDLPRAIRRAREAPAISGARHRIPQLIEDFILRHET